MSHNIVGSIVPLFNRQNTGEGPGAEKCGMKMPREVAISSPGSGWEAVVKCGRREHPPVVDRGVNSKSVGSQLLGS